MKRVIAAREYETPQEKFLTWLSAKFKVNGPSHRGARMPSPVNLAVNESAFPDNLRPHYYECEVVDDSTIQVNWESQGSFNGAEAEECANEIMRCLEAMYEYYIKDAEDVITFPQGTISIVSRDGRDEGFYIRDI